MKRLSAEDLGEGPWGQAGSPTQVGEIRVLEVERQRNVLAGSVEEQVDRAVEILLERGALDVQRMPERRSSVPEALPNPKKVVGVVLEPNRARLNREILGAGSRLARDVQARVIGLGSPSLEVIQLGAWGADELVEFGGVSVEEDLARGLTAWAKENTPWALLLPSTAWGREVGARTAAAIGAGLTGDAVDLEVENGRLTAWKPAFGGATVASIRCSSPIQMATVRAGVLSVDEPRPRRELPVSRIEIVPAGRVKVASRTRDDDGSWVAHVRHVVSVGLGVPPEAYGKLKGILDLLDAELVATRKVTDRGHMPRARQVGITGHSIAPRLCIAIGTSGKFNHMAGFRQAGTIVAINSDPEAFVWEFSDVGIVARWEEVLPLLHKRLSEALGV